MFEKIVRRRVCDTAMELRIWNLNLKMFYTFKFRFEVISGKKKSRKIGERRKTLNDPEESGAWKVFASSRHSRTVAPIFVEAFMLACAIVFHWFFSGFFFQFVRVILIMTKNFENHSGSKALCVWGRMINAESALFMLSSWFFFSVWIFFSFHFRFKLLIILLLFL